MLLPSAFDCDIQAQTPRPSHISSAARRMLSPPPSFPRPTSPMSTNLFSTCRALQSLLATSLPSPISPHRQQQQHQQPPPAPALQSPITLHPSSFRQTKPLKPKPNIITNPVNAQRPSRKRRRSSTPSQDQENVPTTPKRQRIHPPSLPKGLRQEDFAALQPPSTPFNLHPNTTFTTPSLPLPFTINNNDTTFSSPSSITNTPTQTLPPPAPSPPPTAQPPFAFPSSLPPSSPPPPLPHVDGIEDTEEAALLALILTKLRIRRADWDALGREGRGSMGKRFRVLFGEDGGAEGMRGMRRGRGGLRRGRLSFEG